MTPAKTKNLVWDIEASSLDWQSTTSADILKTLTELAKTMPPVDQMSSINSLYRYRPKSYLDPYETTKNIRSSHFDFALSKLYPGVVGPVIVKQAKVRNQPPKKLTAMQLRDAELRHVPGLVLQVDDLQYISTGEHIDEITEWVQDHCEARVHRSFTAQMGVIETFRFMFDSDVDKVMFKLRWPCD